MAKGEMGMIKAGVYLLVGFVLCGCAAAPVREAVGTKYTSDIPPLEIEFAYKIGNVKNHGNDKFITLYTHKFHSVIISFFSKLNLIYFMF